MAKSQCSGYPDVPCRVNLDLMPGDTTIWMWGLTLLALGVFAYGVWEMIHVWRLGKSWKAGDLWAGLKRFIGHMATQRKFRQDPKPGTNHAWVFFGFVVLFIGTTLAFIDMDIFELLLKQKLLEGTGYLIYEATLDLFALVFIMGVVYMMLRRYKDKPEQLHPTKMVEAPWWKSNGDFFALLFLLLIGVTGLLLEALRLHHQITEDGIQYAHWSFAGNFLVILGIGKLSMAQVTTLYPMLWWFHFAMWTSVLAILPWTKLKHILTSSLNLILHDPERQARANLPTPFNLQEMMESGDMDLPDVGYSTIRDLTWKDRLALDACTNCGRCEAQCPAHAAGRPLSPRKFIQDLKGIMWDDYRAGKKAGDEHQPAEMTAAGGPLSEAINEATLWSCTTCRACMTECPVNIEHVDIIVEMRRAQVMASKLDEHQGKLLMNLTNAGNPYGFNNSDRADWTNGLPESVEVPMASAKGAGNFEYLWWVGCVGSFDPRNQEVTQSVARILNASGVSFAILGPEEKCNGDPARRLGEEGRFQQSVMENLMLMQQYGVKKVITQCPHCFNTLQNEYPEFGAEFEEVIHHTTLIERLIDEGKVPLKEGAEMKIAYHDSCYLGRHNDIFEAPRRVLERTNNGLPVLEMAQSREQGLCCGAGGSNMWYEIKEESERINVIRAKQAADTGADTVATACPFCLTMMKDGLSLTGNDEEGGGNMIALDLAEIVARHLDVPDAPEPPAAPEAPADAAPAASPPVTPTPTPDENGTSEEE